MKEAIVLKGRVKLVLKRANGCVETREANAVVDVGKALIIDRIGGLGQNPINAIALGTNPTAVSPGQTALISEGSLLATTSITDFTSLVWSQKSVLNEGVPAFVWLGSDAPTGTLTTLSIEYTNQANVSGKITTVTISAYPASTHIDIPLAPGDTGIRSIDALTVFSGSKDLWFDIETEMTFAKVAETKERVSYDTLRCTVTLSPGEASAVLREAALRDVANRRDAVMVSRVTFGEIVKLATDTLTIIWDLQVM